MKFPLKGVPEEKVLQEIEEVRRRDPKFEKGEILGTMITAPHPIAIKAFFEYLGSSLGDITLFPGAYELERRAISMLGSLLSLKDASGTFLSGGSEANLLGVYLLRRISGKKKILIPKTAHFSFKKAESLGIIEIEYFDVDERLKAIPEEAERKVDEETGGIVGIAVNTEAGAVDPIKRLSEVCEDYGLPMYVDAALGGLFIPFAKAVGKRLPDFDFRFSPVAAIGVDPHKLGMVPPPAGTLIFRPEFEDKICFRAEYMLSGRQITLIGTRSAAPPVASYAVFRLLGFEGFLRVVSRVLDVVEYAKIRFEEEGYEIPIEPETLIVNVRVEEPRKVAKELARRGIKVGIAPMLNSLRIVVMPHVKREHIDVLIEEMKKLQ